MFYGVRKETAMNTKLLRQKILDLAIRGKLTEQKKSDGTTKDLLAQIQDERRETKDERDAGKKDSSNVIASTTSTSSRTPIRDPFAASKNSDDVIASTAKQSKKKTFAPKEIIPLDKSEAPFEIPENWEWVKIGDLFNLQAGKFIPADKIYPEATDNLYPCYGGNGLRGYVESYNRIGKYPLIGRQGALCGNINFASGHFYATEHAIVVETPEKLDVSWACYFLKQLNLNQYASSTAQPGLSVTKINEVEIPLPPLAEQKRIVEAIESAFAEITAIENNQELLKKHIKQGRQKILDLAIRGKLTEQKESDGTTKDLLAQIQDERRETKDERDAGKKDSSNVIASEAKQSKKSKPAEPKTIIPLNKDEAPFEIPENWEWVRLGDLSEKIQYGYNAPAKDTGRIKMVRITDIHDNAVEWDSVPFCDIEESEIPTYLLKKNDILFARTGGTVGKSFIVNEVPEDAVYAGYLIRTRYGKNINAQYMKFFMESNLYWVQLREGCIATAQPNCNGQTLGKMQIPLPPLAEQQRIVSAIESAFTEFDAMEKGIL